MNKRFFLIALFSITAVSIIPAAKQETLDALASATMNNKCKITSITSTDSTITFVWTENHHDGTMVVSYSTGIPPIVSSRAVTAAERQAQSITLHGLLSGATYSIEIDANKTGYTPYGATSEIITSSVKSINAQYHKRPDLLSISQNGNSIQLISYSKQRRNISASLFNLEGKEIAKNQVSGISGKSVNLFSTSSLVPGSYILKIRSLSVNFDRKITIRN